MQKGEFKTTECITHTYTHYTLENVLAVCMATDLYFILMTNKFETINL